MTHREAEFVALGANLAKMWAMEDLEVITYFASRRSSVEALSELGHGISIVLPQPKPNPKGNRITPAKH